MGRSREQALVQLRPDLTEVYAERYVFQRRLDRKGRATVCFRVKKLIEELDWTGFSRMHVDSRAGARYQ